YRFIAAPTAATGSDPCDALQPTPTAAHTRIGFSSTGPAFVIADSVLPGTPVFLFEEVQYDVATSAGGGVPGRWIRRMAGYSGGAPNMQPMAGPVPEDEALQFAYRRADGTPAMNGGEVREVDVRVVTQSRALMNQGGTLRPQQVDTAATTVYLRNV